MSSRFITVSANKRWCAAVLFIFAALLLVMRMMSAPSIAQSSKERVLENTIPKDLPFKIKIKKEKEESFKDLKNDNWLREFELELTNTGDKPIYFFYLTLVSDVTLGGQPLVFPLTYGRAELGDIVTKASSDDIPIQPGEMYVLKVRSGTVGAWERSIREQRFPQATRLQAVFQELSFGDGTGYFGNHPYPPAGKRQSILDKHMERMNKAGPTQPKRPGGERGTQSKTSLTIDRPAVFLPAKFLPSESLRNPSLTVMTEPDTSCDFPYCVTVVPWTGYVCYDNGPKRRGVQYTKSARIGSCRRLLGTRSQFGFVYCGGCRLSLSNNYSL
jgi:hypothetical protein